ncbi:MAG TPA: NADH-quinone oxidoreductase subunit N [Phycisphaerae bacterium]|nr:NADH-quinone oxidoreductase subunit N [Phycisphaerae bacterium]HOJ73583.1 NADH-quinone oxidoreductase subunit N [Phycisphaerae bacterium]HOM51608.1 NADH-quinone oxidoreductase subunit N [Phycisphaerae bacterium]HON65059.1 NADH-quinone oxidoreductase subunit N [Phycisphaerae bacterium]HOQ85241.1 NADH-quinone oxidoreductase subunit N [Phycisphaerae bacterium]
MPLAIADIWIPTAQELTLIGPELGLVGTIVAVLLVTMVTGRHPQITAGVALLGTLGTLLLTSHTAGRVVLDGLGSMAPPSVTPMLVVDNFSVFFKLFVTLFLALITWLWLIGISYRLELPGQRRAVLQSPPEFFVLLLTSALGMCLMVGSLNLLVLMIAIETASLPSYAIVASNKRSRVGAEASIKYVLFGATTAAMMVYGISLLYGVFHTLDLPTIAARVAADPAGVSALGWLGLLGLGVGVAFKISAFPLHFWCPDVFEGAPIEVTTWLSVASKAAGLGLLLRIVHTFVGVPGAADDLTAMAYLIGAVAAITCTVGNLAALRQTSVKRMLAYSSIAHAGYMMMAAAVFVPGYGRAASLPLAALIAYVFVYLLMNLGAFGVTAMVAWKTGSDHISSFTGLGRRSPWLAVPMAICLFSLVGLPPLGGFAAKWWLLVALGKAASAAQTWLWALVIVAVLNTAISLYYYVGVIRQMYLTDDPQQEAFAPPLSGLAMVNGCALLLILLGTVFFNPLGQRANTYASNLFAPAARQVSGTEVVKSGVNGLSEAESGTSTLAMEPSGGEMAP